MVQNAKVLMHVLNIFLPLLIPPTLLFSFLPSLIPPLPQASNIMVSCVKSDFFLCMYEQKDLFSSPPPFAVWEHAI